MNTAIAQDITNHSRSGCRHSGSRFRNQRTNLHCINSNAAVFAGGGPSGDGLLLNDGISYVLLNDDSFVLLNG